MTALRFFSVSLLVPKHEDATDTSNDGRKASEELQDNYLKVSGETIRGKIAELAATPMISGQDADDYFTEAKIKRAEVEAMGEPTTDQHPMDIVVEAFSFNESIKLLTHRDRTFNLTQIQT